MTSEVVVMNSLGVALATDSAATVSNGEIGKVFNSADKLFMLSKRHPVGVMIYGNAAILGVPWETIIKMFRRQLDGVRYDKLEDYGKALIAYLDRNEHFFPQELQDRFYLRSLEQLFAKLADRIEDNVFAALAEGKNPAEVLNEIALDVIAKEMKRWESVPDATCLETGVGVRLAGRLSDKISELIAASFSMFRIDHEATEALYGLARLIVAREKILPETLTGLVVAGFGESEHFPVMQHVEIGEIYEGRLKYRCKKTERIDCDNPSHVEPFADADMVNTFLHGMNPRFEVTMMSEFAKLVLNLPDEVVNAIGDLDDKQKAKWKRKFKPESHKAYLNLVDKLEEQRREKHLGPIRQAVINMPKDELGHAAARLVSLNWFQKRMSLTTETVGGPVDVAVISKGDGFVWIERKHYFRPELNRHFFENYHFTPQKDMTHEKGEKDTGEKIDTPTAGGSG